MAFLPQGSTFPQASTPAQSICEGLSVVASSSGRRRLDLVGHITVERCHRFAAEESFIEGARVGARAVGGVGSGFQRVFRGYVEDDVPSSALSVWNLRYAADDATLIDLLGGIGKVALPLSSIHQAMRSGEDNASRTDWRSNFAYARARDGSVWAVHWILNDDGDWVVGAVDVPHPVLDWAAESRLFTRMEVQT